ncbi:MAG: hypothetical protein C4339_04685 [Nitrososphaerota archaeon]
MRRSLLIPLAALAVIGALLLLGFVNQAPLAARGGARVSSYGPYVKEYDFGNRNLAPYAIKAASRGYVWFVASNTSQLFRLDPATGAYVAYKIPSSRTVSAWGLDEDANGTLWFTSGYENLIWSFDPQNERFSSYAVPRAGAFPGRLLVDPKGVVWFTEFYAPSIGYISPSAHAVRELRVPGLGERAGTIELALAGQRLWFTWVSYEKSDLPGGVGYVDLNTLSVQLLQLSRPLYLASGLTVDPSGRLWLVQHGPSLLISVDPVTGSVLSYSTSAGLVYPSSGNLPYWAVASDGRVYFNEHIGNKIGFYSPEARQLVEVKLPLSASGSFVNAIFFSLAPSRDVWFSEVTEGKVGVVHFPDPLPFQIAALANQVTLSRGGQAVLPLSVSAKEPVALKFEATGSMSNNGTLVGIRASFSEAQASLAAGQAAQLSLLLEATNGAAPGRYTLTVTASSQYLQVSTTLELEVMP